MRLTISSTAACLALLRVAVAVNTVEVRGQDFVDSKTNDRFVIIGVDYQPGGQAAYGDSNAEDVLSNGTACLRDAALMQRLGVNTIRSYNVDPTLNHDDCASIFNEAGIYMIIDVNSPLSGQSLDRSNPSGTYTTSYLEHTFAVVEAFKNYPNTLGFFAGNEVINDVSTGSDNPPYIRAIIRDLKQYIAKHASRTIPVGYSAADVREILQDTYEYLSCAISGETDDMSRADMFGLNSYSWCGSASNFQTAGYDDLVSIFSDASIPIFFSEYGCNDPAPRVFDEVPYIYGSQMTVLSGGLVYEWSQETSDYGLVSINSNGSLNLLGDYDTLQSQYATINVTLLESSNSTATAITPPNCAASLITESGFASAFSIPSAPSGAAAVISSGISSAPTGSIVSVTQTSVQVPVYATDGAQITGLVINPVTGANTPSSSTSSTSSKSGSSRTSSASGSSSKSSGLAPKMTGVGVGGAIAAVLGAGILAL